MNWTAIITYVVISFGILALMEVPVYLTGGIAPGGEPNPLFFPLTAVGMFSPAIAALITTFAVQRPAHPARFLGLAPVRPWRRTIAYSLIGFFGSWVIGLLGIVIAFAFGVVRLQVPADAAQMLAVVPLTSLVTAALTFGEELGWRGFLLPALRPLGTWPALIGHGVLWGLWHTPAILLGYNYNTTNPIAVLLMIVTTTTIGCFYGWLRMRSGSVYPSTFAHGALNGSTGIFLTVLVSGGAVSIVASPLGWAGWAGICAIVLVLAVARTFRWAPQAAPRLKATPRAPSR